MIRRLLVLFVLLVATCGLAAGPPRNEYEDIARIRNVFKIEEISLHAKGFNFSNAESVSVLVSKLNDLQPMKDGEALNSYAVLAALFEAQPEACFEFAIDNFGKLNACGRVQLAKALGQTDFQENQILLRLLLRDKEKLPSERERQLAAMPYRGHLRVCDYAYSSFMGVLKKGAKKPGGISGQMHHSISIEDRDKQISHLVDWWDRESPSFLPSKASVAVNRPAVGVKLNHLQRQQGQGSSRE